jgi:general secretion pathway protein G
MLIARKNVAQKARGFTLIELIVATAILLILSTLAIPLVRVSIKREKEHQLRQALWDLRDAIDRYKEKLKFLRRIPIDPMTNSTEWGLHSMQDDPDSDSWGEQNVFDVFTKSQDTALDGTKYRDW